MAQLKEFYRLWSQAKRLLLKVRIERYPVIPIAIILIFAVMAIFAGLLALHPPNDVILQDSFMPPFWQKGGDISHPLGTDMLGRDMLSRIIYGSRVSFTVALLALTVGGLGGTALGIIAAFRGGKVDMVIMGAADSTLSFPVILIAVFLAAALGATQTNVVIAISIALWARFARAVRGEVLSIKERDFVALARVDGCSKLRIMAYHIFPNILNTVLILLTLQVGWVILAEASLSFLGAGIPPPAPSWGSMIARGRGYIVEAWWIVAFPGLAILFVVLSFNLTGDWLREALDPKLRQVVGGG